MSDIFREVDEALQQEKLEKLWAEYKTTAIAAVAILVLGTAFITGYKSWDASRNAKETQKLLLALDSKNPETEISKVIQDTRSSHKAIGTLTQAGLLVEQGKNEEATALYKSLSEDRSVPKNLRDLSRILYSQNSADSSIKVLKPLLEDDKSPWIWHARLQAAVASAHTEKNYKKALAYLKPFESATRLPPSLIERAQALNHVYKIKSAENEQVTTKEQK